MSNLQPLIDVLDSVEKQLKSFNVSYKRDKEMLTIYHNTTKAEKFEHALNNTTPPTAVKLYIENIYSCKWKIVFDPYISDYRRSYLGTTKPTTAVRITKRIMSVLRTIDNHKKREEARRERAKELLERAIKVLAPLEVTRTFSGPRVIIDKGYVNEIFLRKELRIIDLRKDKTGEEYFDLRLSGLFTEEQIKQIVKLIKNEEENEKNENFLSTLKKD